MERIRDLERRLNRPWRSFRRQKGEVVPAEGAVAEPGPRPRRAPALPSVTVAAAASHPGVTPVVEEATRVDLLVDGREAVARADLILVDDQAWASMSEAENGRMLELLADANRPPVVLWETTAQACDLRDVADVVLTLAPEGTARFAAGSFAPQPPARATSQHDLDSLDRPTWETVAAAAAGVPLLPDRFPEAAMAAHGARRWAWRHHRPSHRLTELLDLAHVSHPGPDPRVAAILVSNRPDLVASAVERIGRQTWRPTEIIVGLHGFDDPGLRSPAPDLDLRLLRFDERLTLGECLNQAISCSTATAFAKIDDDDYYGPAYLEDAVYDLMATTAPVTGKASVFAYLAGEDRTVIRRPGVEHRVIEGIFGGNTMVFRRSFWEEFPFPHRPRFVDRIVLEAARAAGVELYSGSRFEFCAVRHGKGHTYGGSDALFAAGADQAWDGFHPERCLVPDLETVLRP